jgi:hypothetical protein
LFVEQVSEQQALIEDLKADVEALKALPGLQSENN